MSTIIHKIKHGNQEPLIELYRLYRDEFIHFAFTHYGCDGDAAKDVFQEVILAFYENVKSGKLTELNSGVKTYLFAIGKFKLINHVKKESRSVTFDPASLINGMGTTNPMEDKEEQDFIKQTVHRFLNEQCEDCKKVLELYYFQELDMKSIAKKMGYKNADVAKKKKYECFKKLAEMVKKNLMVIVF